MQGPRWHFTLAAIVLLGLLAASYHVFSGAALYDEGFAHVAAMRIGFGEFPLENRIGHYQLLARRDKASMKTAHASGMRLAPAAPVGAM